jgi:dipeptidyl aminopeptidase/acylaminoacyl peptidase
MRLSILMFLAFVPGLVAADAPSAPVPLEHFIQPNDFDMLRISPDGEHYAVSVPYGDRTALAVLRARDLKQTAFVTFARDAHVSGFVWVNPRQIVYSVASQGGRLAAPRETGYLYRVNADGSGAQPVNAKVRMWLADELRDDDDRILVGYVDSWGSGVGKVRLDTGEIDYISTRSPLSGTDVYFDHAGELRLVSGYWNREHTPRLYLKKGGVEWHHVNVQERTGDSMDVLGFSADNRLAYLAVGRGSGTVGLETLDMETHARTPLLEGQRVDLNSVLRSPVDGGVILARYLDGKPKLLPVRPEDRFTRELLKLERAFPDAYVQPTSYTRDGGKGVYLVSSDVNSGDFYLVDHQAGKAALIASRNTRLDPERMAPMRPFRFKARDGEEIEGFLTVPRSAGGEPAPMVVMPHGGPKGIFDIWGFDQDVQILASRGYAVLQVNFRGSGNYGRRFRELGNGEWGGKMQDDVTDATHWALAQGVAAPGRICIYGASYGAYSAMMGLVREPGLYACGIGNVGVYDLPRMYREDAWGTYYSREYIDTMFGDMDRKARSPVNRAAEIKVPVLLGAGEMDSIAPVAHTRDMHKALSKAGREVEMVTYPGEAHGYALAKNELDWQRRVLALLDRTIGRPGKPAAPSP